MSLRLRCAILCGLVTGGMMLLVCIYAYAVHSRLHYDELDQRLANDAKHVAHQVKSAGTSAEMDDVLGAGRLMGTSLWLYDSMGGLRGTPSAEHRVVDVKAVSGQPSDAPYGFLAAMAPGLRESGGASGTFRIILSPEGRRWRHYVLPLEGGGYLEAALPLAPLDASVRGFGRLMVIMGLVGTAIAFGVGGVTARHALRPVDVLTDTAAAIAESRAFSRRVPAESLNHELGRLGRTFNDMLTSLEQAYATQQRFVSDASHELRAPLTVIQANLELARRPALPEADREESLREASEEADRLTRLVGDLLVLARADAGLTLRAEAVELDRVFLQVLRESRHLLRGQRLEFSHVEPCVVRGDPDRIRQLVFIVVENAIKYTPPGGLIEVALRRAGPWAELTVRDTGVGIAATELPRVFERFYRAEGARSLNPGGSGLGLAIGRWIATQHKGSLELESEPGRGTVATVWLPAANNTFTNQGGGHATEPAGSKPAGRPAGTGSR